MTTTNLSVEPRYAAAHRLAIAEYLGHEPKAYEFGGVDLQGNLAYRVKLLGGWLELLVHTPTEARTPTLHDVEEVEFKSWPPNLRVGLP